MTLDFTIVREPLYDVFQNRRSSIHSLPSIDKLIINTTKSMKGCWVAGGAPLALYTGEYQQIKDWDVFFQSQERWEEARKVFEKLGFVETMKSDWSVSFQLGGVILQLITRHWYNDVSDIFKRFDFTVCCFALDGDDFCYINDAKNDITTKEFNFIYTENLAICIKRIARYGAKGYFPSTRFASDIAKAFRNGKLDLVIKDKQSWES